MDAVLVTADRTQNQFGDTITEQSYYRTGGDVKVITREEIELRHYTDLTDAIKRVPGVTFHNMGYRGGEYGFSFYNNGMSINGDSRVVVLIDGRRIDNAAGTRFGASASGGTRTMVDLNQTINIVNVEKIEVIKGSGASAYGADATGGVINIITRKGAKKEMGTLDVSTGSWGKHVTSISYEGSIAGADGLNYIVSMNRDRSGNLRYHDGLTDKDYDYVGTDYKEDGVNIRLDKKLLKGRSIRFWYNHKSGRAGYPITARDYRYWSEKDWHRILQKVKDGNGFGNTVNPGYRNVFSLDALSGSYNAFRHNDYDLTYVFQKENDMESFLRLYEQRHVYWGVDRYPWSDNNWWSPDGNEHVPFPDSPAWKSFIENYKFPPQTPTKHHERNRGISLQYGKALGQHDVLVGVTFDKAKKISDKWLRKENRSQKSTVKRDSILGFIQDKIHLDKHWDFTPALRYSHYDAFQAISEKEDTTYSNTSSSIVTPALYTQYAFDKNSNIYLGITKVYRPIKLDDYNTGNNRIVGPKLEDEKGMVYTLGIKKNILSKTTIGVHYDFTDMKNAVTQYSVRIKGNPEPVNKYLNATEKKKSFNLTLDHNFDKHWTASLAYTHLADEWKAKNGIVFDPDVNLGKLTNVNSMINQLRPQNHYTFNIAYSKDAWYTGLLCNYYTGCNRQAFTSRRAMVIDWNVNYSLTKDSSMYLTINNLLNTAYENAYSSYNGLGAAPQPGRSVMVGVRQKF